MKPTPGASTRKGCWPCWWGNASAPTGRSPSRGWRPENRRPSRDRSSQSDLAPRGKREPRPAACRRSLGGGCWTSRRPRHRGGRTPGSPSRRRERPDGARRPPRCPPDRPTAGPWRRVWATEPFCSGMSRRYDPSRKQYISTGRRSNPTAGLRLGAILASWASRQMSRASAATSDSSFTRLTIVHSGHCCRGRWAVSDCGTRGLRRQMRGCAGRSSSSSSCASAASIS